jgi:hypothetical protein
MACDVLRSPQPNWEESALISSLLAAAVFCAEVDPALLEKVVERSRAVESYTANCVVTVHAVQDELDDEGRTKSTEVLDYRVTRANGKTVGYELLKKVVDGEDVSEAERRSKGRYGEPTARTLSPFHPEQVAKYRFALLAPPASNPSLVRLSFQPAGDKRPELLIGDATIDPSTGDVLALSARVSKTPRFVDSLTMEVQFQAQTPAGRALSRVTGGGAGGFAFIRKRFRNATSLTYAPLPPPEAQAAPVAPPRPP